MTLDLGDDLKTAQMSLGAGWGGRLTARALEKSNHNGDSGQSSQHTASPLPAHFTDDSTTDICGLLTVCGCGTKHQTRAASFNTVTPPGKCSCDTHLTDGQAEGGALGICTQCNLSAGLEPASASKLLQMTTRKSGGRVEIGDVEGKGAGGGEAHPRSSFGPARVQAGNRRGCCIFHGDLERSSSCPRAPISKVGTVASTLVITVDSIPKSDVTLARAKPG